MAKQVKRGQAVFTVTGSSEHWKSFENGTWEAATFNILDTILSPGSTILDIGGWIGPISLYAAHRVEKIFAFEPDPVAFKEFSANLALNPGLEKHITIFNKAITTDGKKVRLFSRFTHGDSGSSLLKRVKSKNDYVEVESTTFDSFLQQENIQKINFIKMDIEGGEFFILPQINDFLLKERPDLLISFHHAALCEYYELKHIPWGPLRRLYRLFDPNKSIIKSFANKKIKNILRSLQFYNVYDPELKPFDINKASYDEIAHIDMLLFSIKSV